MRFAVAAKSQLLEDRRGRHVTLSRRLPPLELEPLPQLRVAVVPVEDLAHVQLRRDRAVPLVRLELEGDVVAPHAPEPVELRAETERDRAAGVAAVVADAEAEMLPVSHCRELGQLATR